MHRTDGVEEVVPVRMWTAALLAAAAVVTAAGCASPAPPAPPEVASNDVVLRAKAYAARIEAEVPGLQTLTDDARLTSTSCPDPAGPRVAAGVGFSLPPSPPAFGPALRSWATTNGFRPATTVAAASFTVRAPDGIALSVEPAPPGSTSETLLLSGPCSPPAGMTGTALPPISTPRGPARVVDARAVCERPGVSVLASGARFAGRGPHPVAVADVTVPDEPDWSSAGLPAAWTAGRARAQLVACVRIEQTSFVGATVTCRYDIPRGKEIDFQVNRAAYRVTVLEAATGRRVATFAVPDVPGTDESDCPRSVKDAGGVHGLAQDMDGDRFETALAPLVLRSR